MAVTLDASGTFTPVIASRTVADAVTNTTVLVTSATAAFVAGDQFRIVTGSADFPIAGNWIATVSSGTNVNLFAACTAGHSGQTLNLTSEYMLDHVILAGTFTFHVDTINMAAGDVLELRVYQKLLTGGTPRVAYMQRYADAQPVDDLVKVSVPISNELAAETASALMFTLKQTAGTARAFPWKVLKYA